MHRNINRKTQEKKILLNQNNQVTRMLFKRIPKYQATTRTALILQMCTRIKIGVKSVEIPTMWKNFSALQRNSSVKLPISLDVFLMFATKRSKHPSHLEDQMPINYKQEQCMQKRKSYADTLKITVPVMIPSACRSRCSTHKPVERRFPHQLTS